MENKDLKNIKDLLIEIKNIINQPVNEEKEIISLNSIINVLRQPEINRNQYAEDIKNVIIDEDFAKGHVFEVIITELNNIKLSFEMSRSTQNNLIFSFYRKYNDWYSDLENYDPLDTKCLFQIYNVLRKINKDCKYTFIFDEIIENLDNTDINTINTCLNINFSNKGITINYKDLFSLLYDINENKFNYSMVSNRILHLLYGKEDQLLKQVYLKIKDCPEKMQTYLKKIRERELAKPKYIEPIPNETNVELVKQQNKNYNSSNNQKKKKFKNIFKKH